MSEVMRCFTPGGDVGDGMSKMDKKTFLAGEYKFVPELLEVWVLIY
jgi:hypothetical protein